MAVYSLLLFLVTYGFIHASFADYQGYILLGFAGVCVIAGVLLAVATVPWMQTACNLLANHLRAKHPSWEEKLTGAGHKLALLQAESRSLLRDPSTATSIVPVQSVKIHYLVYHSLDGILQFSWR